MAWTAAHKARRRGGAARRASRQDCAARPEDLSGRAAIRALHRARSASGPEARTRSRACPAGAARVRARCVARRRAQVRAWSPRVRRAGGGVAQYLRVARPRLDEPFTTRYPCEHFVPAIPERPARACARQRNVAEAEAAAATWLRVRAMSDAPLDAALIMRMTGAWRPRGKEFRRNAAGATTRMSRKTSVLTSVARPAAAATTLADTITAADPRIPLATGGAGSGAPIPRPLFSLGTLGSATEYIFSGSRAMLPPSSPHGSSSATRPVARPNRRADECRHHALRESSISDAIRAV